MSRLNLDCKLDKVVNVLEGVDVRFPIATRAMCKDALYHVRRLIHEDNKHEAKELFQRFIDVSLTHGYQVDPVIIGAFSLDPFLLATVMPDHEAIKSIHKLGAELFTQSTSPTDFSSIPRGSSLEKNVPYRIALVLFLIHAIKVTEDKLLEQSDNPPYSAVTKELEPLIYDLFKICLNLRNHDEGMRFYFDKVNKNEGARKGGEAKKLRYSELKAMVLEETKEKYSDKPATIAAREIYSKLGPDNQWLFDEKGKPLSVDPTKLFVDWIREDRGPLSTKPS